MRFSWLMVILLAVSGSASASPADQKPTRTIHVCDLLKHLKRYKGKVVTVRGVFNASAEISALHGSDAQCRYPFSYGGADWPTAVSLQTPGAARKAGFAVPFEADSQSLERFSQLMKSLHPGPGAPDFWTRQVEVDMTVTGMVRVMDRYVSAKQPNGTRKGSGFGSFNAFVAEIIVKQFDDLQPLPPKP